MHVCLSCARTLPLWQPPSLLSSCHLLSGRDVSNGTYRIDIVRQSFQRATRQLEALARGRSVTDTSINYLSVRSSVMCVIGLWEDDLDPHLTLGPQGWQLWVLCGSFPLVHSWCL